MEWATSQVSRQAKLALATILLSVTLLLLSGATSIPSNQLAVSGSLGLAAIALLLFLMTYRREPEKLNHDSQTHTKGKLRLSNM